MRDERENECENDQPVEPETDPRFSDHTGVDPATPFILRDARFGRGGGVPGIDPDDWMSIKHLVRGAGG